MRMVNGAELISLALVKWAEEHDVMLEKYLLMAEKPKIPKGVWN